ncbi:MAG: hypothetical protein ABSA77_03080 [Thermoguttaceae bacterium]
MYKVATFLVDHFWGKSPEMADALGVLLLTWNNALYRYGIFDFFALEATLRKNMNTLKAFRDRDIKSFTDEDRKKTKELFTEFLDALKIADGKKKGTKSPVAVAKALHLLAPAFFPLWDYKIAKGYGCNYSTNPISKYLTFIQISKDIADELKDKVQTGGSTLLKVIDEYNYARFTKNLICQQSGESYNFKK